MKPLYKRVLKKITPNKVELLAEKKLVQRITGQIKSIEGKHSHAEWCGSSARGTHLRGDRDIDLFIMFDKKLPSQELEAEGIRVAKEVFDGHKWERAYSQHPYIRGEIDGFEVEIVPSYIVPSGAEKQSAVDRTPFHNKYLLERMNENKKQQARLLKQFLKGIKAYGADLKNQALPGYGAELLVLHYGDFEKTIKAMAKWGEKTVITLKKIKRDPSEEFIGPLIIIDPVDENRNVASALSAEQYQRMVLAAQKFLKKPDEKFFFGSEIEAWPAKKVAEELEKREFIAIEADFPKKTLPDLAWGQLRRFMRKAATNLEQNDFVVKRTNLWSDEEKAFFILELNTLTLEKKKKLFGPKWFDSENVRKFLSKKRKVIEGPKTEGERITLTIQRSEQGRSAKNVLGGFLKESKRAEKKDVKDAIKNAKVLTEKEILKHYSGAFADHLTKYLEGKEFFE